jgi:hypothetical protein
VKIKYESCDGISVVEEEVEKIEFYDCYLICTRSKENKFYKENDNTFQVDVVEVEYVKSDMKNIVEDLKYELRKCLMYADSLPKQIRERMYKKADVYKKAEEAE